MMAWMDERALAYTLETRRGTYFSRSRNEYWVKGLTSGAVQEVREVRLDCDGDTVLYRVDQVGPACHTGQPTCFSTVVRPDGTEAQAETGGHLLTRLAATIRQRAAERPDNSYTVTLLDKGAAKAAQKVGEEAVEVVIAANAETSDRLASESADLLYHLLVLLEARRVPLDDVLRVLEERER